MLSENPTVPLRPQNNTVLNPQEMPKQAPKKRNFLKVFIICFIVLIIVLSSVLYFSIPNSKSKTNNPLNNPVIMKMAEKLPIPKITMVPITLIPTISISQPAGSQSFVPVPTLTENWSTYKNSALNFSIEYPTGLKVNENLQSFGVGNIVINSPDNNNSQNNPDYEILIYPSAIGKLIGQDFEVLYALPAPSTERLTMGNTRNKPRQFTKLANRIISGYKAFNYSTTDDPPDPSLQTEIGTYIEIGDSTLIISTSEYNQAILDHMLSSLKTSQ